MTKAPETALSRALRLLGVRQRTARELDAALARAKVPLDERKAALARVRELGYLDDREVARSRARALIGKGNAPRLLARKLAAQGIAPSEARAAAVEAAEGAGEDELAAQALQRRLRGRTPADDREKQRLFRQLVAKGHRPSAVARAIGMELDGDDAEDDPP